MFFALCMLGLYVLAFSYWYPGSKAHQIFDTIVNIAFAACLLALLFGASRRHVSSVRRQSRCLDLVVSPLWRRLGALLIDATLSGIPFGVVAFARVPSSVIAAVLTAYAIVVVVYFSGVLVDGRYTIGKRLFGIRVSTLNGQIASKKRALLRGVVFPGTVMSGIFAGLTLVDDLPNVAAVTVLACLGFLMIDFVFVLVDCKWRRSLHDRLAGTYVACGDLPRLR